MKKWFNLSYKSLRKTVAFLQEKRTEQEERMLVWMQFRSYSDAMPEIEKIFRQNKHLKLHRSRIFRAWYKSQIDYMVAYPEIYRLSMTDGTPYDKNRDPFYDTNAPDWEQYDRRSYYEDDDNYDDDDYLNDDGDTPSLRKTAQDGFSMGIGFEVANNILNK